MGRSGDVTKIRKNTFFESRRRNFQRFLLNAYIDVCFLGIFLSFADVAES